MSVKSSGVHTKLTFVVIVVVVVLFSPPDHENLTAKKMKYDILINLCWGIFSKHDAHTRNHKREGLHNSQIY